MVVMVNVTKWRKARPSISRKKLVVFVLSVGPVTTVQHLYVIRNVVLMVSVCLKMENRSVSALLRTLASLAQKLPVTTTVVIMVSAKTINVNVMVYGLVCTAKRKCAPKNAYLMAIVIQRRIRQCTKLLSQKVVCATMGGTDQVVALRTNVENSA